MDPVGRFGLSERAELRGLLRNFRGTRRYPALRAIIAGFGFAASAREHGKSLHAIKDPLPNASFENANTLAFPI
jgi:hypothetical protein